MVWQGSPEIVRGPYADPGALVIASPVLRRLVQARSIRGELAGVVGLPGLARPRIARRAACVYNRRMPRIQVYLPDELHREVKRSGLSPSELLQEAVRAELLRRQQIARLDEYLGELEQEVGKPTRAVKTRADAIVRRMTRPRRTSRRAS